MRSEKHTCKGSWSRNSRTRADGLVFQNLPEAMLAPWLWFCFILILSVPRRTGSALPHNLTSFPGFSLRRTEPHTQVCIWPFLEQFFSEYFANHITLFIRIRKSFHILINIFYPENCQTYTEAERTLYRCLLYHHSD